MLLRSSWRKSRTAHTLRAPALIGVEQEFDLFSGESYLDFRRLFPQVVARTRSVPFRNCDSAVILDAGYMLACDGREAEFATAPVDWHGDGCLSLAREAVRCRLHMLRLLKESGVPRVSGYSTHLSVSVPIGREWEIARAFAKTVGPALILLMEARQSPGLLIRPRRGRLEIGSEYLDDERQIAAAILLLTGAVRAYLQDPSLWRQYPRVRLKRWEAANIRPGIYLPHDAYGESLHERGRAAPLELTNGEQITAGKILESCAELSLCALKGQVSRSAARTLQRAVRKVGSLQIEQQRDPAVIKSRSSYRSASQAKTLIRLASGSRDVTPAFVDWEGAAFSWNGKDVPLILGIPWSGLPQFFAAAEKKQIPEFIASLGPAQAQLNSLNQLRAPRAYASIDPVALGTQALNDKGMHAGVKGGTSKHPKRVSYTDFPETESVQVPAESSTLAQTLVARRPAWLTDSAQTIMARRPATLTDSAQTVLARRPSGSSSSAMAASSQPGGSSQGRKSRVGWIIAAAVGVVVLSVLAVSAGIVVLSHASPTKTPTLASTSAAYLSQSLSTPTLPSLTPVPTPTPSPTPLPTTALSATPAIPTFTLHENAFCRKGPDGSYPDVTAIPNGDTVEILGVSQDGFWYFVYWRRFDARCWVAAATGQTSGNSQGVPVLAAPATSAPTRTAKPSRTPQPTVITTPTLGL